jgi:hypothetical protein
MKYVLKLVLEKNLWHKFQIQGVQNVRTIQDNITNPRHDAGAKKGLSN